MGKKILILSAAAFLSIAVSGFAKAQDGVYIDYSVLDSLQVPNPGFSSQPLFPQVNKSAVKPAKKAVKKVAAKKRMAKPAVKKKPAAPKQPAKVNAQMDTGFFQEAPAEVKDSVSAAPVAPISTVVEMEAPRKPSDPVASLVENAVGNESNDASNNDSNEDNITIPAKEAVDAVKDMETQNAEAGLKVPAVDADQQPAAEIKSPSLPEGIDSVDWAASSEDNGQSPRIEQSNPVVEAPQPLIPSATSKELKGASNQIFFEKDSAELGDLNQKRIDAIIKDFSDPINNKIAIYAYNLDNGQDVFRKKRLNLNRAVEVRSYLLQKGYKNFSIKVINVTDQNEKENLVEIEELK